MSLERDIKQFLLKALLRAKDQPINDDTLRSLARSAFAHVAITETDFTTWIRELESSGVITGTSDEVFGITWTLSLAGKHKASQLK
jgi:hypothetical protein